MTFCCLMKDTFRKKRSVKHFLFIARRYICCLVLLYNVVELLLEKENTKFVAFLIMMGGTHTHWGRGGDIAKNLTFAFCCVYYLRTTIQRNAIERREKKNWNLILFCFLHFRFLAILNRTQRDFIVDFYNTCEDSEELNYKSFFPLSLYLFKCPAMDSV